MENNEKLSARPCGTRNVKMVRNHKPACEVQKGGGGQSCCEETPTEWPRVNASCIVIVT